MEKKYKKTQISLYISMAFLLFAIAIEFISILLLNNGFFVYTLDDPYIHMALAENIRNWHYGINMGEFSAPSSSILWPFIIMPFSAYEYTPFVINVIAAVGTVFVIIKTLSISIYTENHHINNNIIICIVSILFILATNIIGLPFTGMEHSLQVLIVLLVAYGMIVEIEKRKVALWFLLAVIVAPLIRYECLAISIAAVAYLLLRGYLKQAVIVIALIAIFLGVFSTFLISLGLDLFPTSVLAKSSVVESAGALHSISQNIQISLGSRQGKIISFGIPVLLLYLFGAYDMRRKHLAIVTIIAISIHFIAGRYGWYHRYEIYILAFVLLVIIYLYSPTIKRFIEIEKTYFAQAIILTASLIVLIGLPYIQALFTLPFASNNIYEQQYQMHRFAVYYYNKSVAVNDLGYVSYKNDNYVLDLWGLGSKKAFLYRTKGNSSDWMKKICEESNVELVMIYQKWFKDIPEQWIEIGKLRLGKQRVTPADSEVFFYATSKEAFSEIVVKLDQFIKTLPDGVEFIYSNSK